MLSESKLLSSKGERTREHILHEAAVLFNTRGYSNTSISDVMHATGLQKGGIYNHFTNKEELTVAAFEYAFTLVRNQIRAAILLHDASKNRLQSVMDVYENFFRNPPLPGGCPVLNAAVEFDDDNADTLLRKKVKKALELTRRLVRDTVKKGIAENEIRADVNPDQAATVFLSVLQGALMMSKLFRDSSFLRGARVHLNQYIESISR